MTKHKAQCKKHKMSRAMSARRVWFSQSCGCPCPSAFAPYCRSMRILLACLVFAGASMAQEMAPILINKNFEGGSLGKVEKLGDAQFRLHVEGQYDERGR